MKYNEIKLNIIKKIRDIYFFLRFGRGKFFLQYINTFFSYLIFKKKYLFDLKNTNFSNKWFYQNISYINFFFKDKKENINKILEIGSFEGQSALFFLKYFINARITCVDIWQNQNQNYKDIDFNDVEKNFDKNLEKYQERITKFRGSSNDFFEKNTVKDFDLIFVPTTKHHNACVQNGYKLNKIIKSGWPKYDLIERHNKSSFIESLTADRKTLIYAPT